MKTWRAHEVSYWSQYGSLVASAHSRSLQKAEREAEAGVQSWMKEGGQLLSESRSKATLIKKVRHFGG